MVKIKALFSSSKVESLGFVKIITKIIVILFNYQSLKKKKRLWWWKKKLWIIFVSIKIPTNLNGPLKKSSNLLEFVHILGYIVVKCKKKGFFVFCLNPGTFQFFPTHIINQRRWRENITWMNDLWKLELWTRYFHSSSLLVVKAYEGLKVCCLVRLYKNFDIGIHCNLISFVMIKKTKGSI